MNASYGKMAQTRQGQEIIIDNVELALDYLKRQYKIVQGIRLNYMYMNQNKTEKKKPYYMPIVPTLINAEA